MIELLGYLATGLIFYGFTKKTIKQLRIYNCVGASLMCLYGVLLGLPSVIILNGGLALLNLYHLVRK